MTIEIILGLILYHIYLYLTKIQEQNLEINTLSKKLNKIYNLKSKYNQKPNRIKKCLSWS